MYCGSRQGGASAEFGREKARGNCRELIGAAFPDESKPLSARAPSGVGWNIVTAAKGERFQRTFRPLCEDKKRRMEILSKTHGHKDIGMSEILSKTHGRKYCIGN